MLLPWVLMIGDEGVMSLKSEMKDKLKFNAVVWEDDSPYKRRPVFHSSAERSDVGCRSDVLAFSPASYPD